MPRVQGSRHPIRGGVADPGRCEGPRGRPKAGKVVICEKCGARYAMVQPPKYTNGWNYDKIASASGRELPEGEPASDEGSQAPAPASAPSAANSKES